MKKSALRSLMIPALLAAGCTMAPDHTGSGGLGDGNGKYDSSVIATFRNFTFDGEIITYSDRYVEQDIESQLMYTVGQLNGENSLGRIDTAQITNIQTQRQGDKYRSTYRAVLHVAWGNRDNVPETYEMILPKDMTTISTFVDRYKDSCTGGGAHDVTSGSMWYYYRPRRSSCELMAGDVMRSTATLSASEIETDDKSPEYNKVWEDDVLRVVHIFGKDESDSTSASDLGVRSYLRHYDNIMNLLRDYSPTSEPAMINREITTAEATNVIRADLGNGKSVEVHLLLTASVSEGSQAFYTAYNGLSTRADFISYSGHAGLGAHIRALANNGRWTRGQYVVVMMDGCDTYAYVSSALADAHTMVNPDDDPDGTKYLDIVMNAMPSPFGLAEEAPVPIVRAMLNYGATGTAATYQDIFRTVNDSQVILVAGEQDNRFPNDLDEPVDPVDGDPIVPGGGEDPNQPVPMLDEVLELSAGAFETRLTHELPIGTYRFTIDGDADADLYVRIGMAPNEQEFDCSSTEYGAWESCDVTLTAPSVVIPGIAARENVRVRLTSERVQ